MDAGTPVPVGLLRVPAIHRRRAGRHVAMPAASDSRPVTDPVPMALDPAPVAAPPAVPRGLPSASGGQVRVTCMLDACQLTFGRVSTMKRHALQLHGL